MSYLIVAAHPDDEVLGCGGTAARLAREGQDVFIAILGEGMTSRQHQRQDTDPQSIQQLGQDAHRAAKLLGARELFLFGLPDNRFDTVPLLDVVKQVEQLVRDLAPETVFTQHGGDLNIDHAVTYRAVLTATRPMQQSCVKRVLAYEVASSTEWAFSQFAPVFHPQVYYDISDTLETKIAAMQAYRSEARPFPHPRSPEALRAAATRCGCQVGLTAAESFQVVREIR